MLRRPRLRALACVLAIAGALAGVSDASAARNLIIGFTGDEAFFTGNAHLPASTWLDRAHTDGASMIRVSVGWSGVAPSTRPPGFNPSDPASPGYNWTATDQEIEAVVAHGMTPVVVVNSAPTWAEGPGRPRGAAPGSWRPSPAQFGAFAHAIALHYDGQYRPAGATAPLPRVRYFQGWNEANLSLYLAPQWIRARSGYVPESPALMRGLENAFYTGVKAVEPSDFVVMGGTAPYGDPPGGQRMQPVAFYRSLFCLQGAAALTPVSCPGPTHLDAIDHHPYAIGSPLTHALNPDDAAVPDLYKITRVLHAAERAGRVLPSGPKQLWVTEMSWDSDPPDPHGVPIQTQARWLEQAMYEVWRQGASVFLWLEIVDAPPIPNYASTYQAGIYYIDGSPKPAVTAFSFPFVTQRLHGSTVQAWGVAPSTGTVSIERQTGASWSVIARQSVAAHQVFTASVNLPGAGVLRAVLGTATSLTWSQAA